MSPDLCLCLRLPRRAAVWCAIGAVSFLTACATTQPVVYQKPNASAAAQQRAAADSLACRQQAEAAVGVNGRRASAVARSAGRTGAIGWASTAVAGLVGASQDVWKRARVGAAAGATGAVTKTLLEWNDPDDVHREYVERCMGERGHDVLGWR